MTIGSPENLTVQLIRFARFDVAFERLHGQHDQHSRLQQADHAPLKQEPHATHCLCPDRAELSCEARAYQPLLPEPTQHEPSAAHRRVSEEQTLPDFEATCAQDGDRPNTPGGVHGSPALAGLGLSMATLVPGTLLDVVA